jgi:hypothetical protein
MASLYHTGVLWVAPLVRLLDYTCAVTYLDWEARKENETILIEIKGLKANEKGSFFPLSQSMLMGLTFYTPHPSRTKIIYEGRELAPLVVNEPDYKGLPSVTIPTARMERFDVH